MSERRRLVICGRHAQEMVKALEFWEIPNHPEHKLGCVICPYGVKDQPMLKPTRSSPSSPLDPPLSESQVRDRQLHDHIPGTRVVTQLSDSLEKEGRESTPRNLDSGI